MPAGRQAGGPPQLSPAKKELLFVRPFPAGDLTEERCAVYNREEMS